MRVVVTIPYREAPGRAEWLAAVRRHYDFHFPDWEVVEVDAGGAEFHRAATRNACVREAERRGADVVVINDADVVAKSSSIRAAVEAADRVGGLHMPFEGCKVLSGAAAEAFVRSVSFPSEEAFPSTGGCYVIRPADWWAFGGADEGFIGWGGEDDAIVAAAEAVHGPVRRHPGTAVSLGHTAERLTNPHYAANMYRTRLYQGCESEADLRALLRGRDRLDPRAYRGVAVVAPSRGRPENISRLRDAIRETAITDVTILVGLDEDDAGSYPRLPDVEYTVRPRQRLNAWWNELAQANLDRFHTFVFLGDDNVPRTPGWDFLLDDELRQHGGAGFATGPDLLRRDRKFTWAAISAEQLRRVGYVGPPGLTHLCIDSAWQSLADATGTKYWLDHCVIEHVHYARTDIAVEKDATYAEANSAAMYRADTEAWQAWQRSSAFEEAVAVVKGLNDTGAGWEYPGGAEDPHASTTSVTAPVAVRVFGHEVFTGEVEIPVRVEPGPGGLRLVPDVDALAERIGAQLCG